MATAARSAMTAMKAMSALKAAGGQQTTATTAASAAGQQLPEQLAAVSIAEPTTEKPAAPIVASSAV